MSGILCPSEETLSRAIFSETLSADVETHLRDCSSCREEIELGRSALRTIRSSGLSSEVMNDLVSDQSTILSLVEAPQVSQQRGGNPEAETRPTQLGNYKLLEVLNTGGQGIVYRAWDSLLHRIVAIKLCHCTATLRRVEQLRTEGALLAKIDHPALARVLHVDVHDGRPYLVMELIDGQNLRQYLALHRVSLERRLKIIVEVAAAVAAAHRGGVLHLDLKPENVMIDRFGRVKLVDLGMGRRFGTESEQSPICGTLEYMAPEQLDPNSLLDARTDVFGIGAILYFLLTERPLVHRTAVQTIEDHAHLLRKTASELSESTEHCRLKKICAIALSPNPASRYPSAEALARAVRTFQFSQWSIKVVFAVAFLLLASAWAMCCSSDQDMAQREEGSTTCALPVQVDIRVTSPEKLEYDFYLATSAGATLQMRGLMETVADGHRMYQLAGARPLTVTGNDWIMLVAVPSDCPQPVSRIVEILAATHDGDPPGPRHFKFRMTSDEGLKTTIPQQRPSFLEDLANRSRDAGVRMAGCYLATNNSPGGSLAHLQIHVELDQIWDAKMY